ncbi:MAG: CDP-alcohol phosphatidyltransferase family protein [Proteobacteria bacterium]|nr:CDP-alcohol phosphatidyltransferase family protein [Pseudomonadota bacterium]
MNLPNLLSVFRLFVTIFFIIAINHGRHDIALILFIIQALSDVLDGFLARIMKAKTHLGAFLDPVADKVMIVSSYIVLSVYSIIPFWLTYIVIIRDVVISTGFFILYKLSYKGKPTPIILSKITTLSQMCTVIYILWPGDRMYSKHFFYATAVLSVFSGFQYVVDGMRIYLKKES